ncbi:MAG: hypothetical protein WC325_13880 [Candidatus Bathyarchaeia archaeon]
MSLCSKCLYGLGKNSRCQHPDRKTVRPYTCDALRFHSCKRFAPKLQIDDKLIAQANNDALINIQNRLRFDLAKVSGRLEAP